jgi:Family of unknown function (DUF5681)
MAKARKSRTRKSSRPKHAQASEADYDVGYAKPPAAHQFKPGQSGNRRGRPPGRINIATALRDAVQQKRPVTIGGKAREMSTLDVILRKQIEKAVTGDTKAFNAVMELPEGYAPDFLATATQKSVSQEDKELLADYAARQPQTAKPSKAEELQ